MSATSIACRRGRDCFRPFRHHVDVQSHGQSETSKCGRPAASGSIRSNHRLGSIPGPSKLRPSGRLQSESRSRLPERNQIADVIEVFKLLLFGVRQTAFGVSPEKFAHSILVVG